MESNYDALPRKKTHEKEVKRFFGETVHEKEKVINILRIENKEDRKTEKMLRRCLRKIRKIKKNVANEGTYTKSTCNYILEVTALERKKRLEE